MEKTTKKKKKAKGLRKRIGIIAVGGLSLVLTICLSVGATLAWFAGSTWSSEQMYMGGPVYVEMAGAGTSGATAGGGDAAAWKGGSGNLDIKATSRDSGTVTDDGNIPTNILLPGQRFEIYSQARVFSTAYTTSVGTSEKYSTSTGATVTNTSKDGTKHIVDNGRVTSTTTSVLRARFTISVEFDPSVGFNNFTNTDYRTNYPVQSGVFNGANAESATGLAWSAALGKPAYKNITEDLEDNAADYPATSRRDAVPNGLADSDTTEEYTDTVSDETELGKVKSGDLKSIYSWKFVSESVYNNTKITADDTAVTSATVELDKKYTYAQMPKPFDGTVKINNVGYYGVWILTSNGKSGDEEKKVLSESDSFYKARCNSYIDSYVEEYMTEYGEVKTRTVATSIAALENELNQSFINLINDSSDNIIAGKVFGMTVDENGIMTYADKPDDVTYTTGSTNASWLYVDPSIGNDTNTNELSTSAGGWWYLVESDNSTCATTVADGTQVNRVTITKDSVTENVNTPTNQTPITDYTKAVENTDYFVRSSKDTSATPAYDFTSKGNNRLDAKLFEISPLISLDAETLGTNGKDENGDPVNITKVVSYSFPFVNGSSIFPGDALTNIFANAKINIQISFQALQAFFPYSTNIDNLTYKSPLLGTAKALSIRNAIPIYNEAFDYQENVTVTSISGL